MLWINDAKHNVTQEGFGFPTYEDWCAMNRVFDDIAACIRDFHFLIERDGETERAMVSLTTYNTFSLLGVEPTQGRAFSAEEDERGDNVAVISHSLWQRRFGTASPVGESLRIDGRNYEVIGVMPAGFGFPHPDTMAWMPWPSAGQLGKLRPIRQGDWLRGIARLKPDVTVAEAQQDMDRMAAILAEKYPPSDSDFAGYSANVVPVLQQMIGASLPRRLWMLLGAVGFVFVIACLNVMNLLVVRNEARRRELAVREALGASRGRLVRLRFAEAFLLSAAALLVGVTFALVLVPVIVAAAPVSIPRLDEIRVDWTAMACAVVLATAAATMATALSGRPHGALLQGARSSTDASATRRLQSGFIVAQVALSLVLLCGVGLFVRSLQAAIQFDPGFVKRNVTLAEVRAPSTLPRSTTAPRDAATPKPDEVFFRELFERLKAGPGVLSVGATTQFLIWLNPDYSIVLEGEEQPRQVALMGDSVSPGYFEAMGTPLVRGRLFADADVGQDVALVNETMARQFWLGRDPIGKRFRPSGGKTWYTVIGIVGDMRRQGIETTPIAQMFRAGFADTMNVAVRSSGESSALAGYLREQLGAIAPGVPLPKITTVEQTLEADRAPRRFHTLLLTGFALVALLLCAIGLFGLQRYTVERRRREIGLRMAVGAQRGDVVRMMVGHGARLVLIGGALGLLGSLWLAEFIQSLLFEVSARDQATLLIAGAALGTVGVLASYLPARRASRIDPMEALRHE
jgi:putative ABC transport system permease protein